MARGLSQHKTTCHARARGPASGRRPKRRTAGLRAVTGGQGQCLAAQRELARDCPVLHIYTGRLAGAMHSFAAVSVFDSGIWERQLPQLAEPLAPPDHKAQLTV